MSYKKIGDYEKLPDIDLERDGEETVTEFRLLSSKSVQSKMYPDKMNTVYNVEVEDKKMQFWGNPVLDRKLGECSVGNMIKVIYLGKIPHTKKGYNPIKNFDVFEDDGTDGEDESQEAAKKKVPF